MNVEVLPLRRFPRTLQTFTYRLPQHFPPLQKGAWVRVPFRHGALDGILWSKTTTQRQKKVLDVLQTLHIPALTKTQCRLIEWMSKHSAISLSHAASVLLPKRPQRIVSARNGSERPRTPMPLVLDRKRLRLFENVLSRFSIQQKHQTIFIPCASLAERIFVTARVSARCRMKQVAVIAPTLSNLSAYSAVLTKRFPKRAIVLDPRRSTNSYWTFWQAVGKQHDAIVLMTRRGLGCALHNLGMLILDEETNPLFKQFDQNPRYHVRSVAKELQEMHQSPLLALDRVPSLNLWHEMRPRSVNIPLPRQKRIAIDLLAERRKGENTLYAETVVDAFRETKDARMLVFHRSSRGVVSIFRATQRLFPSSRIAVVDSDTELSEETNTADIVIGTEKILYRSFPPFQFIVIPLLDALLAPPEYAAQERMYQLLERVAAFATPEASLYLQTTNPHSVFVRAFCHQDVATFYRHELTIRKKFLYPPFVRLSRLIGPTTEATTIQRAYDAVGPLPTRQRGRVALLVRSASVQPDLTKLPESWLVDTDS